MKIQQITEILNAQIVADTRKRDFQKYKQNMAQAGLTLDANTFKQAMDKIFAAKGQEFNLPMPTNFANDKEALDWINKASGLYVMGQLFAQPVAQPNPTTQQTAQPAAQQQVQPAAQPVAQQVQPAAQQQVQTPVNTGNRPLLPAPRAVADKIARGEMTPVAQPQEQPVAQSTIPKKTAAAQTAQMRRQARAPFSRPFPRFNKVPRPAVFRSGRTGKMLPEQAQSNIHKSYAQDLKAFEMFVAVPQNIASKPATEAIQAPVAETKPQGNDILDLWTKLKV
jgi:hypothetical protein